MKFRVLSGLLTVAIIILFVLVVKYSYALKESELDLKKSNDDLIVLNADLVEQKNTIDSLFGVNKKHLETLKTATDSIYFDVARTSNTFRSYKNYVNNFGAKGENYLKALTNLNAFFPKKGYVQLKESNGRELYAKFADTVGFPKTAIMILGEPSVTQNNLYICKSSMNVRKGVIGNDEFSNTSRNGDVIWEDQKVKVLEVIESGSAKWVHIAYGNK